MQVPAPSTVLGPSASTAMPFEETPAAALQRRGGGGGGDGGSALRVAPGAGDLEVAKAAKALPSTPESRRGGADEEEEISEDITEDLDFGEISGEAEKMFEMLSTPAPAPSSKAAAASGRGSVLASIPMRAYDNPLAAGAESEAGDDVVCGTSSGGGGLDVNPATAIGAQPFPFSMKTYTNPLAGGSEGGGAGDVPIMAAMATAGAAAAGGAAVAVSREAPGAGLSGGVVEGRRSSGGGRGRAVQGSLDFRSSSSDDDDDGFGAASSGGGAVAEAGETQQRGYYDDGAMSDSSAELEVFRPPPPRGAQQQQQQPASDPFSGGKAVGGEGPGMYRLTVTTGTKVSLADFMVVSTPPLLSCRGYRILNISMTLCPRGQDDGHLMF